VGRRAMADRLLTAREVADRFCLKSSETILRWVRKGKLPAIKLPSGAIRFEEAAVERCEQEWATLRRGSVSHPDERRPTGTLSGVSHPQHDEED
jgi:excisionase family DNA binding protein